MRLSLIHSLFYATALPLQTFFHGTSTRSVLFIRVTLFHTMPCIVTVMRLPHIEKGERGTQLTITISLLPRMWICRRNAPLMFRCGVRIWSFGKMTCHNNKQPPLVCIAIPVAKEGEHQFTNGVLNIFEHTQPGKVLQQTSKWYFLSLGKIKLGGFFKFKFKFFFKCVWRNLSEEKKISTLSLSNFHRDGPINFIRCRRCFKNLPTLWQRAYFYTQVSDTS